MSDESVGARESHAMVPEVEKNRQVDILPQLVDSSVEPIGVSEKGSLEADEPSQADFLSNLTTSCNEMFPEHPRTNADNVGIVDSNSTPRHDTSPAAGIPTLLIKARTTPFWATCGRDISDLPLQHDTWCVVFNPCTNKSKFELLCECQEKSKSGSVIYNDVDWGKGVHPEADKEWMKRLKNRGEWSTSDCQIQDVISRAVGERDYITVFLNVVNEKKRMFLNCIRRELGYDSDDTVRVSFTEFLGAGGDGKAALDILQKTPEGSEVVRRRMQRELVSPTRKASRRSRLSIVCQHHASEGVRRPEAWVVPRHHMGSSKHRAREEKRKNQQVFQEQRLQNPQKWRVGCETCRFPRR